MCLKIVSKKLRVSNKERTAYKIFFHLPTHEYEFMYRTLKTSNIVPVNTWVKAEKKDLKTYLTSKVYSSGFHCYLSKKTAEKVSKEGYPGHPGIYLKKIVKVRIRKVHTLGKETCKGKNINVIVADEMFVPFVFARRSAQLE